MSYALESGVTDGTGQTKVVIGDSPNLDGFARLRISDSVGLFDSIFQYDLAPLLYNAITSNGGTVTHLPNQSSASLNITSAASSSAALQSKAYHRYVPAKSQLCVMTAVLGAAVAGAVKRVGYFDVNDGIFLEQNGTTDVAFVRRTSTSGSAVDNRVVQADWNLDNLTGVGGLTNPSKITLNLANCLILVLDLQWLGMGRVRVGFDIDGTIVYVHEFLHANILTLPYMKTGSLPVRWEISHTSGSATSMTATCASVISEGGYEKDRGFMFSVGTTTPRTFTAGTPLPIIAIRPAATFNGVTNRMQFLLESFTFFPTGGTSDYQWQLLYNPTITGGAWNAVHASSGAEVNITGTAIGGSGIPIDGGHDLSTTANRTFKSLDAKDQRYPWCMDAAGSQIVIAFVATEASGSSDIHVDIQWREVR